MTNLVINNTVMEKMQGLVVDLKLVTSQLIYGVIDALKWGDLIRTVIGNPSLQKFIAMNIVLNVFLLMLPNVLFFHVMVPYIAKMTDNVVFPWILDLFTVLFYLLWQLPCFVICLLLNTLSSNELSTQFASKAAPSRSLEWIFEYIAEQIMTVSLTGIFVIIAMFLPIFPWIGTLLSFIHYCWIYAFYCFDFKWNTEGKGLIHRCQIVETHWAYFLGYGLPFTASSFFFSFFTNYAIYSSLFPLFIILCFKARSFSELPTDFAVVPKRLAIFLPAQRLNAELIQWTRGVVANIAGQRSGSSASQGRSVREMLMSVIFRN